MCRPAIPVHRHHVRLAVFVAAPQHPRCDERKGLRGPRTPVRVEQALRLVVQPRPCAGDDADAPRAAIVGIGVCRLGTVDMPMHMPTLDQGGCFDQRRRHRIYGLVQLGYDTARRGNARSRSRQEGRMWEGSGNWNERGNVPVALPLCKRGCCGLRSRCTCTCGCGTVTTAATSAGTSTAAVAAARTCTATCGSGLSIYILIWATTDMLQFYTWHRRAGQRRPLAAGDVTQRDRVVMQLARALTFRLGTARARPSSAADPSNRLAGCTVLAKKTVSCIGAERKCDE